MDMQGTSLASTSNICELCNVKPRIYTCPKCDIGYCSIDCYKSEAHLECSEGFYKQCVTEELRSLEQDSEDRKKMLEILQRVYEDDLQNMEALASDDVIDEEQPDHEEEQLDSDDDDDILDLHSRLRNVNLDDADEVWAALTDAEKLEFEALTKNGDIEKFLPEWDPWWTSHTKKKLVQGIDTNDDNNEQTISLPLVIDVPIFTELQKASPNVEYNIINVIFAYAYTANYYNGDYLNCPLEATIVFLDLSDNIKRNRVFENCESAITSIAQKIINYEWLPQDQRTLLGFTEAGNAIMQGPNNTSKYLYIAIALSELHRLLTAAIEEVSKNKNKGGHREFSKKFIQRYNMVDIDLSKKVLLSYCKKLEYYLSWTKMHHINMYT